MSANVVALADSAAHRDEHQINEYLRYHISAVPSGVQLELYVDASYAHEANDRRSVSGEVIMCLGTWVSFYSRTKKSIALSSTGAEYAAMTTCFRETIFMRYLGSFFFSRGRDVGCATVREDTRG